MGKLKLPDQVRFAGPLPVGMALEVRGQIYRIVAHRAVDRQDGQLATIHVWQSHCGDCGAAFDQTTTIQGFPDLKRCTLHRRNPFVRSTASVQEAGHGEG